MTIQDGSPISLANSKRKSAIRQLPENHNLPKH